MAYIAPNTDIRLLENVPIDLDYTNTLWFATKQEQTDYFISKTKKYFPSCTYARRSRGVVKVQAPVDSVISCNYMMFRNTGFSDKWFYAFITGVEYISNNTTAVSFVLDNLQTWLFDMELSQCFIVRQHATTDVAGDNLVAEGLETGDYMYEDGDLDWSYTFTGYDVIVYSTFSANETPQGKWLFTLTQGTYRWGTYTGLNMTLFRNIENENTITRINRFITGATEEYGVDNGIVALIMIPTASLEVVEGEFLPTQIAHTVPRITHHDYYYPRNQKLLTAPFCFIEGQNCEGSTGAFPQEYFSAAQGIKFMITFSITTAPTALCVPIGYKGIDYNYSEGMFINNFTQCSYNTDMFKAYMAQSLTARTLNNVVDTVANLTTLRGENTIEQGVDWFDRNIAVPIRDFFKGGEEIRADGEVGITRDLIQGATPLAAAINNIVRDGSAVESVYREMAALYSHSIAAPHNNGTSTPDYFTSNRLKGFWFMHRTLRHEFAQRIDQFFDRFGYAQHKIAMPNLHARQRYTYIKTSDSHVHGALPADAIVTIQGILDKGITFWADHDSVGDYTPANPIV